MKLSALTIYILGISLFLILVSYAFIMVYRPNMEKAQNNVTYKEQLKAEANKWKQTETRVKQAKAMVDTKAAEWNVVVATHTPPTTVAQGGIDLAVNPYQLTVDSQIYRNNIQRAVNAQVRKGGIRVITGPSVPQPDPNQAANILLQNYYNFPQATFPIVLFNLGTVTVQGTFEQISANVKSWSTMPHYLAVADGLNITGTSPNLTGTYTLSLVGFLQGKSIYPPVPDGTTAASAPTGGVPGVGTGRPGGVPPGVPSFGSGGPPAGGQPPSSSTPPSGKRGKKGGAGNPDDE